MKNSCMLAILMVLTIRLDAQTNYSQTLGPFQSCYSSTPFTFTATPPTTGDAMLVFSWGACYMSGPASNVNIFLNISSGSQQVAYGASTAVCVGILDSVVIPGSILADAIQTSGGNITGSLYIQDYCVAGWGCSNFNDPEVFMLSLTYTSHSTNFTAATQSVCPGGTIQFTDQSINNPVSWQWSFPGGIPATSSQQNPSVTYPAPGSYDVSLITSDGNVTDTLTLAGFINVYTPPVADAGADVTTCSGDTVMLSGSGGVTFAWSPPLYISDDSIANPLAYPVNTTAYTLTVTDANGCVGMDTVTVNVNSLPLIIVQAGFPEICLGDTTIVIAVGAQTYSWSPATGLSGTTGQSVFASPFNTTTYTVTGTDINGCIGTGTVTVTVNPLPPAPSITQLIGNLYATPSAGYQWYYNGTIIPGATAQIYTFTQNGIYTVMISDSNGCQSLSLPYNVTNTGLEEAYENEISIKPNPANDLITITTSFRIEQVEIFSREGKSVKREYLTLREYTSELKVGNLDKGVYLLKVQGEGKTAMTKLIIQ